MLEHSLDVMIGATWQKSTKVLFSQQGDLYASDILLNSLKGAGNIRVPIDEMTDYKYVSLYGRVGYNWRQKYLINLTARRDGSSRFGPNNRFGNFGAAGAAWIFSEEKFLQRVLPFLTFGKLRSSYGMTGSDAVQDYKFYDLYNLLDQTHQGVPGFIPSNLYNPDFKWESTRKLEAAVELGFWNNRVSIEASWYRNRSSNQLIDYTMPDITGFPSVLSNFGAVVQNKGWEGLIRLEPIHSQRFKWNTSFNISIPQSKLKRFEGIEDSPYATFYKVGEPLSIQTLYIYSGVNSQTGVYEFLDVNKDGVISPLDGQLINPTEKRYYGGMTNTLQFKRIEFSLFLQYSNQPGFRYLPGLPGLRDVNQAVTVLDRWFTPGDQTNVQLFSAGNITAADGDDTYHKYTQLAQSTFNSKDASFIRLKTLSISYLLQPDLLNKLKLQQVKLFVQGQNLLTFTGYSGLDPETGSGLPPLR
ncbi:MAG: SusC/RagA family TonB-linked outer membrane protein, partial [Pedobacter sp.]